MKHYSLWLGTLVTCVGSSYASLGQYAPSFQPARLASCVANAQQELYNFNTAEECASTCLKTPFCGSFEYYDTATSNPPSGQFQPGACNINAIGAEIAPTCPYPELDLYIRSICSWIPRTLPATSTTVSCGTTPIVDLTSSTTKGEQSVGLGPGRCKLADEADPPDRSVYSVDGDKTQEECREYCYNNDFQGSSDFPAGTVCVAYHVRDNGRCELHTADIRTNDGDNDYLCFRLERDFLEDCQAVAMAEPACGPLVSSSLASCRCVPASVPLDSCTLLTVAEPLNSKVVSIIDYICDLLQPDTLAPTLSPSLSPTLVPPVVVPPPTNPGETLSPTLPGETWAPAAPTAQGVFVSTDYLIAGGVGGAALLAIGAGVYVVSQRSRATSSHLRPSDPFGSSSKLNRYSSHPGKPGDGSGFGRFAKKTSAENFTDDVAASADVEQGLKPEPPRQGYWFNVYKQFSSRFSRPKMARFTERQLPEKWVAVLDPVTMKEEYRNLATGEVAREPPVAVPVTDSVLFEQGLRAHFKARQEENGAKIQTETKPRKESKAEPKPKKVKEERRGGTGRRKKKDAARRQDKTRELVSVSPDM